MAEPCKVCTGLGVVALTDPQGNLVRWEPCHFCQGSTTDEWVRDRREARFKFWDKVRIVLIIATLVVFSAHSEWWVSPDTPGPGFGLYLVAWVAVLVGWALWYVNRRPRRRTAPRHAPGFTEQAEIIGVTAIVAGAALKGGHDQRLRRQQAQLDAIQQQLNQAPRNPA